MKPMSVEQCVSEGLRGLLKNRSRIVPGRLNRVMNALVPASLARKIEADILYLSDDCGAGPLDPSRSSAALAADHPHALAFCRDQGLIRRPCRLGKE